MAAHHLRTITAFHHLFGLQGPAHPFISRVPYPQVAAGRRINQVVHTVTDYYVIGMKRGVDGRLRYGRQPYDFDEGVLSFVAPGQEVHSTAGMDDAPSPTGWLLLVHPDLLWGHPLASRMRQYEFFDYAVNETLFLSPQEEAMVEGLVQQMEHEYQGNQDVQSRAILVSLLETMLNYAERFYRRQFLTRQAGHHQVLEKLNAVLEQALSQKELAAKGLPTVQQLATAVHVSPGYLGSLLKMETGLNAQQHIHHLLLERAKDQLRSSRHTVSEIAFALGFEHSQSFSKLFKAKVGVTPMAFRRGEA